jgi:hypothetical protein
MSWRGEKRWIKFCERIDSELKLRPLGEVKRALPDA